MTLKSYKLDVICLRSHKTPDRKLLSISFHFYFQLNTASVLLTLEISESTKLINCYEFHITLTSSGLVVVSKEMTYLPRKNETDT
jgi:hypothetical protein